MNANYSGFSLSIGFKYVFFNKDLRKYNIFLKIQLNNIIFLNDYFMAGDFYQKEMKDNSYKTFVMNMIK